MSTSAPLIIDCDTGIDDALALALALASAELDVLAVTTVAGNASLEQATYNTGRVLSAFGRPDIPVAAGAPREPSPVIFEEGWAHGSDGLCGLLFPEPAAPALVEHGVDLMARLLADHAPRTITVAALGPLTNIALLLAMYPEASARLKQLVVMGGSLEGGNITPYAEFNIWADPEAAQFVLSQPGIDVRLIGLDATRLATVEDAFTAALRDSRAPGPMLADLVTAFSRQGIPLHDVLALASVVEPAVIQTRRLAVEVDVSNRAERGRTTVAEDGAVDVEVAVSSDPGKFRQVLADRLLPFPLAWAGEWALDHQTREAVQRWR